jgi:hypothetical protein
MGINLNYDSLGDTGWPDCGISFVTASLTLSWGNSILEIGKIRTIRLGMQNRLLILGDQRGDKFFHGNYLRNPVGVTAGKGKAALEAALLSADQRMRYAIRGVLIIASGDTVVRTLVRLFDTRPDIIEILIPDRSTRHADRAINYDQVL